MKIKFLVLISIFLLVFLSSCNAADGGELQSDMPSTTDATSEATGSSEYTTIPPAQELENEAEGEAGIGDAEAVIPGNSSSGRCYFGERTGTSDTATGLLPLEKFNFSLPASDSVNEKSSEMVSHSYGIASGEQPHLISIQYQQFFDEKNFDAVCLDTKTEEKVVYLTFDCGYENGYTSKILDVLKEKNVPAAFFCTLPQIRDNSELIARMINEGHIVGNHSVTHPDFSTLSAQEILDEIKGYDDYIRENFGYSSFYFRFPQGKYSEKALYVLNELGYKCVFWSLAYADWDLEAQKGAQHAYETVLARIHPGAVILLHSVSPDNANALSDIIDTAREKGYEFRSLEDM